MTELEIREKSQERGDGFTSGVLILTLSAVIVKIIGLVYKIPMLTLLGSEGMGYFNSAYEIYTLFGVVSTAGLPVAMSVMISRARCGGELTEKKIFSISFRLFAALGALGALLMLALSPLFSRMLGGDKAIFCIVAISPTVFFICVTSVYRGFFQGLGRMRQTAISQVIEAVLKLALGLTFAYIALRCGYRVEVIAAFAVIGLTLGVAVSALYLALSRRAYGRASAGMIGQSELNGGNFAAVDDKFSRRLVYRRLFMIAVPITLSSAVMSVTKIIDMTVILRRLQDIGYTGSEAFSAYGGYTTLALPIFSLAPALISSVALPLVPSLSSRVAMGDRDGQVALIGDALKLTSVVAMPISLGVCFFSREILSLIFHGQDEAIALCAPLLSMLALSIVPACFITVEGAVLQAYSRAGLPIISMLAGSCLKLVCAYFLIGNPAVSIAGAPISTFLCDILINLINLSFISRCLPRDLPIGTIMKPFSAAFISVTASRLALSALTARFGESSLITLATIAFCAAIYLPISILLGAIGKDDLLSLKKSEERRK